MGAGGQGPAVAREHSPPSIEHWKLLSVLGMAVRRLPQIRAVALAPNPGALMAPPPRLQEPPAVGAAAPRTASSYRVGSEWGPKYQPICLQPAIIVRTARRVELCIANGLQH